MPVYAWICLNKQGSEYVSVRNMPEKIHSYFPADTDVFKTSSGRLKEVTTSYDQTRRRQDV